MAPTKLLIQDPCPVGLPRNIDSSLHDRVSPEAPM